MFSVKSTYMKVADLNAQEDQCLRNIWRLKVPQRCKMHIWFLCMIYRLILMRGCLIGESILMVFVRRALLRINYICAKRV